MFIELSSCFFHRPRRCRRAAVLREVEHQVEADRHPWGVLSYVQKRARRGPRKGRRMAPAGPPVVGDRSVSCGHSFRSWRPRARTISWAAPENTRRKERCERRGQPASEWGIRGPHDLPNHRRAPPSSQEDRPVRRRARAIAPRLQRGPCSPGRAPRGRGSRSWSPDFSARACGDRARTAPEKQLQSRHERVILDAAHTPCTCVGIRRSSGAALEGSWEGP